MKVVLSKEKVIDYINKYYNDVLGIKGCAAFHFEETYYGYGKVEQKILVPKITYFGSTKILDQENNVTIEIFDLDIKNILDHFLAEEGYISYTSTLIKVVFVK